MDKFKIDKPDFTTIDVSKILKEYEEDVNYYGRAVFSVSEPSYLYWDKIKYKQPAKNLTPIEFWYLVKHIRTAASKPTIIKSENGEFFKFLRLDYTDEYLHKIDIAIRGEIFTKYQHIITDYGKQRLLTKSIIEEAIASSQLEGAVTTTPIAKRIILENKPPKDKSEQMIINNYRTMQLLRDDYKNKKLTKELLFELHRHITKKTIDSSKQGRYRTNEDNITLNDQMKFIYHVPPNEKFLYQEMDRLITFANDENKDGFVHPIIKAILLHFWIVYLHPFYDGNGRLARTLFYWYLLKKGYWAIQYLPISLVIKQSRDQYGMSFVYSEQDGFDLTYFYDFHIKKIIQALDNFSDYIDRKTKENKTIEEKLEKENIFNERQKELLRYFIVKGEKSFITPTSYVEMYKVSRMTASSDLKNLEKKQLIISKKIGKYVRYYGSNRLRSLF
jgi:Fic family protein